MYRLVIRPFVLFAALTGLFFAPLTAFSDENSFGYRIFKMQKKQALIGSRFAQYKLGTFYEFGISVKPDPQEAIVWYKQSAGKGYKPAKNRLQYLGIKQNGYNAAVHSEWVKKIKEEAAKQELHSIVILGQLKHYGLGVEKDLITALALLREASSRGYKEIEIEIDEILKQTKGSKVKVALPASSENYAL